MRLQRTILAGIIVFLAGVTLDTQLFPYSYVLIIAGSVVSYYAAFQWFRNKENRARLKETLTPKRDFAEQITQLFDFRWARISVLWTVVALFGMLIVHAGSILMRSTGAYECAIGAIKSNEKIIQEIGEVKSFAYMITGHTTSGMGFSELSIGVIGTRKGVYVKAIIEGFNGNYVPTSLTVEK